MKLTSLCIPIIKPLLLKSICISSLHSELRSACNGPHTHYADVPVAPGWALMFSAARLVHLPPLRSQQRLWPQSSQHPSLSLSNGVVACPVHQSLVASFHSLHLLPCPCAMHVPGRLQPVMYNEILSRLGGRMPHLWPCLCTQLEVESGTMAAELMRVVAARTAWRGGRAGSNSWKATMLQYSHNRCMACCGLAHQSWM